MTAELGEGMHGFLWTVGRFCSEASPSQWMCKGHLRSAGCRPRGPSVDQVGGDG